MTKAVDEGGLRFEFPDDWQVSKYDDWAFYRNQLTNAFGGARAVDVIAVEPGGDRAWLMEIKDYRIHFRTKAVDLPTEVAEKVRDTLAGLAAARINAGNAAERRFAARTLKAKKLRIVLHLEQQAKPRKLFPKPVNPANVKQKLRPLVCAVDPHPLVLNRRDSKQVDWTVK